ncbi:MAG: hypothetical protein KAT20_02960 [Desulfuromonadales bacterium]|nr:hypothetical protein [Desulfuromonadales bacterium]
MVFCQATTWQVALLQKSGDAVPGPLPVAVTAAFGDEGQIRAIVAAPLFLLHPQAFEPADQLLFPLVFLYRLVAAFLRYPDFAAGDQGLQEPVGEIRGFCDGGDVEQSVALFLPNDVAADSGLFLEGDRTVRPQVINQFGYFIGRTRQNPG